MSGSVDFNNPDFKPKSFWNKPEGVTGAIFLVGIIAGVGYLLITNMAFLVGLIGNTLALVAMLAVLAAVIYIALDPKARTLLGYAYKSIMRWITGIFVTIDPIGILKNYVDDLQDNLSKMSKQIGKLRGQMRKLKTIIQDNNKEIEQNMRMAGVARDRGNEKQMLLASRKAARLKDSNEKYSALTKKMDVMHRILSKMYQNSEILLEDTKDQVKVKEQERKAIRASHSAMKSAMSIISGDKDKRAMFDQALEAIADDVSTKVGEMERFMEMSANFMESIDLQNGVFEEEGLRMLEKWEKESTMMLLGDGQTRSSDMLDLDSLRAEPERRSDKSSGTSYDKMFD